MTSPSPKAALEDVVPNARTYQLGGVAISTDLRLPGVCEIAGAAVGLSVAEGPPEDFRIQLCDLARPLAQAPYEEVAVPLGTYIRWQHDIECLVERSGTQVLYRKLDPRFSDAALRSFVFGHVFSHALALQGIETLHGTATVIGGSAVAVLGNCGYGKSTLATWLLRSGLPLMTDDILVVRHEDRRPVAYPGLPQIKLRADSARALFDPAEGALVCTGATKLIFPLGAERYWPAAAPLRRIYLLAPPQASSTAINIEPAVGSTVFLKLMENIFIDTIVDAARQKRLFALLERLCAEIPIRLLSYPRNLEVMPEVVARMIADTPQAAR